MRRIIGRLLVLAAAMGACAQAPEPLNSERIAAQFGSYGVEILAYDARADTAAIRRASLFSTHDGARICRTYAITQFSRAAQDHVGHEHALVLAGASIGATFKANGWQIVKRTRYIGEIDPASAAWNVTSLMQLADDRKLAMHVYRMWLKKPTQFIEYATIIEVHHPDYLNYAALADRYPAATIEAPDERRLLAWQALIADEVR